MPFMRRATIIAAIVSLVFLGVPVAASYANSGAPVKTHSALKHVVKKAKHVKKSKKCKEIKKAKKVVKAKKSLKASKTPLSVIQRQLADLGYYTGPVDGKMGPMTKQAITAFQRDHGLRANGKLSLDTKKKIAEAARDIFAVREKGLGVPVVTGPFSSPDVFPMFSKVVTRYAPLDVKEDAGTANGRSYLVSLNGAPLLTADNQPSSMRISPVYEVAAEDAVLFTTYVGDSVCPYKNQLVVISPDGSAKGPMEIQDCQPTHVGHVSGESLFIGFPNGYDQRNIGDMWRYENGTLNQL